MSMAALALGLGRMITLLLPLRTLWVSHIELVDRTLHCSLADVASRYPGICAPYVPSNPAIITGCPSTVTPAATPTPYTSSSEVSPASSSPVPSAPAVPSTITYYSTQEVCSVVAHEHSTWSILSSR